jgi:SAM-dependent methyltransferase
VSTHRPDEWEDQAGWWQEHFTEGADPEYEEQILPLAADALAGAARVLDLGCGEGQVARRVAAASAARVVGVDLSWHQVLEAARRGGGPAYVRSPAGVLPFAASAFDAVVVCLVLEHVDDIEAVLAELARVLEAGGRLVLFLNHPLLQTEGAAWVIDHTIDPPEHSWRVGPYLHEAPFLEQVEKGVFVRFVQRPLSRYLNALIGVGFDLVGMDEPAPPEGFLAAAEEYREQAAIPRLMVLYCRRRA